MTTQQRVANPLNVMQQPFQGAQVLQRPQIANRPILEQFDQAGQKQPLQFQKQDPNIATRLGLQAASVQQQRLVGPSATQSANIVASASVTATRPVTSPLASASSESQEIPDNVTAELEKLEQENGGMVEVEGVGDILGGLADDDDDILAEMGADFNILEYADPELDALTGGEKTNILDSLDLEESEPDKDDKKDNKQL